MKVILAKTAGFCWGVKRAVQMTREARKTTRGVVMTHGPLIHNRRVVRKLQEEGIAVYDSAHDAAEGILIIRAHGIAPQLKKELIHKGFKVLDATCPHVMKAQKEVKKYSRRGYRIIIAGDRNHAEVMGLTGFVGSYVTIIGSSFEAKDIYLQEPILLIAQSTFNKEEFLKIADTLQKRYSRVEVIDTICGATSSRQKEIIDLAKEVDSIVVVGDRISANTKRLVSIAESLKKPVYFVEGADEINDDEMKRYTTVGVTAGASTPEWETVAVVDKLKNIDSQHKLINKRSITAKHFSI